MITSFKIAVTISLFEQAQAGPFIFHGDLEKSVHDAARIGFDAVELFMPNADFIAPSQLAKLLGENDIQLAAIGSGAGWLIHQHSLTSNDEIVRRNAIKYFKSLLDWAAEMKVPVILGSMQGRHEPGQRDRAVKYLAESLAELSEHANRDSRSSILYEPLNRYETNIFNRVGEAADWIRECNLSGVKVLADLFHMNIEESSIEDALIQNMALIGHVHWADSNRRYMGGGHTDFRSIANALSASQYAGYLSAEAFPIPSRMEAAVRTYESVETIRGLH